MKKNIIILLPILLFSCKENSSIKKNDGKTSSEPNVVENIEQKSSDPFQKTYRTNDGMVDDIYNQLILNDKNLTKLDTQIKNLNAKTTEVIATYEAILANSSNYYKDAQSKTSNFSDTLLQKKVDSIMNMSINKYNNQTINVRSYIAAAQKNIKVINEKYSTFKIFKTLPEIEKYQSDNSFDLTNLNTLMTEQNKVLSDMQNLK